MGVISHPINFFGNGAAQHAGAAPVEDKLERAILASQHKDAAIVHRAVEWLSHWLTGSEAKPNDRMAQAILACQRRDAAIVRHLLIG